MKRFSGIFCSRMCQPTQCLCGAVPAGTELAASFRAYGFTPISSFPMIVPTMRVAVTGGSGRVGRWVVLELVERGHHCLNLDIVPHPAAAVKSLRVDLREAGEIYATFASFRPEVVVHLGAWAGDGFVPTATTYNDNTSMTYNVFQASADLSVKRVVWASSHHVYGTAGSPPAYFPLDEDHPMRPVGPYGLSKLAGEHAAEYFTRVRGVPVYSFRLFGVREPREMDVQVERTAAHPEGSLRLLWTRMDARDAAVFFAAAVEDNTAEPGPYHIAGQFTLLAEDTETLIDRHFGPGTERRARIEGRSAPISTRKAQEAFGYSTKFNWSVEDRFPLGEA